jgi:hypothetical protein
MFNADTLIHLNEKTCVDLVLKIALERWSVEKIAKRHE